jgi:hypothetical protein
MTDFEIYEPAEDPATYPDYQLTPLKGGRYVTVLHGPPGTDVGDLHCDLEPYMEGGQPAIISHSGWLPTEEQIRRLKAGAHIRLAVFQHPIPPLAVSVEEPVCACHGHPMTLAGEAFVCRYSDPADVEQVDKQEAEDQVRRDFSPEDG